MGFTVEESLRQPRLVPMMEDVVALTKSQFGYGPGSFENLEDTHWHNGHEVRIHSSLSILG